MTLVGSDVLIADLRGDERARRFTGGVRSAERPAVWRLLGSLTAAPVTERIAIRAGEFARTYRRSHRAIGIADYLIAATAAELGLSLATLNIRHFPMFEALRRAF